MASSNESYTWSIMGSKDIKMCQKFVPKGTEIDVEDVVQVENCIQLKSVSGKSARDDPCIICIDISDITDCHDIPSDELEINRVTILSGAKVIEYHNQDEYLSTIRTDLMEDVEDDLKMFKGDFEVPRLKSVKRLRMNLIPVNASVNNTIWIYAMLIEYKRSHGKILQPSPEKLLFESLMHHGFKSSQKVNHGSLGSSVLGKNTHRVTRDNLMISDGGLENETSAASHSNDSMSQISEKRSNVTHDQQSFPAAFDFMSQLQQVMSAFSSVNCNNTPSSITMNNSDTLNDHLMRAKNQRCNDGMTTHDDNYSNITSQDDKVKCDQFSTNDTTVGNKSRNLNQNIHHNHHHRQNLPSSTSTSPLFKSDHHDSNDVLKRGSHVTKRLTPAGCCHSCCCYTSIHHQRMTGPNDDREQKSSKRSGGENEEKLTHEETKSHSAQNDPNDYQKGSQGIQVTEGIQNSDEAILDSTLSSQFPSSLASGADVVSTGGEPSSSSLECISRQNQHEIRQLSSGKGSLERMMIISGHEENDSAEETDSCFMQKCNNHYFHHRHEKQQCNHHHHQHHNDHQERLELNEVLKSHLDEMRGFLEKNFQEIQTKLDTINTRINRLELIQLNVADDSINRKHDVTKCDNDHS